MRIVKSPELRQAFTRLLRRGGTVVFSWTVAYDLSGPQGDDAATIESFMSEIGPHWLPAEMNVFKISRREVGEEVIDGHSCLAPSLVTGYIPDRLYELSPGARPL